MVNRKDRKEKDLPLFETHRMVGNSNACHHALVLLILSPDDESLKENKYIKLGLTVQLGQLI